MDAPDGVDIATIPAWEFFADDLGFEPDAVTPRESRNPANRQLAEAPFRPDAAPLSLEETTVETVLPSSLPGEGRYTGRQVQELLRDGVDPNDIGVVVTEPAAYASRLGSEFSTRSIPQPSLVTIPQRDISRCCSPDRVGFTGRPGHC